MVPRYLSIVTEAKKIVLGFRRWPSTAGLGSMNRSIHGISQNYKAFVLLKYHDFFLYILLSSLYKSPLCYLMYKSAQFFF